MPALLEWELYCPGLQSHPIQFRLVCCAEASVQGRSQGSVALTLLGWQVCQHRSRRAPQTDGQMGSLLGVTPPIDPSQYLELSLVSVPGQFPIEGRGTLLLDRRSTSSPASRSSPDPPQILPRRQQPLLPS